MTDSPKRDGRPVKNPAASVRARLLNKAKGSGQGFQRVLDEYARERLLRRLELSPFADRFVLKGASLFALWGLPSLRPTRDIDLLGFGASSPEALRKIFGEICSVAPPERDGIEFAPARVEAAPIRADQQYGGVRVKLAAALAGARIVVQVDVGFGDAMEPGPPRLLPALLEDMPSLRLRAYPPEQAVAEKFHAIASLGLRNTRLKDFFDLWVLAGELEFEGPKLVRALAATFERRQEAELSGEPPLGLGPSFVESADKRIQWRAFLDRSELLQGAPSLDGAAELIRAFVLPAAKAAALRELFPFRWKPALQSWQVLEERQ